MRQVRDAHREAKELVEAESARYAPSTQDEQHSVVDQPGRIGQVQQEGSIAEDSSATGDARAYGVGPGLSDLNSSVSEQGSSSRPADSAGGTFNERTSNGASEGADVVSAAGIGAVQPPEGINNNILEDYEADELSPVEQEVAAAAEEVGVFINMDLHSQTINK